MPGLLLRTETAAAPLLPAIRNVVAEEAPGLVVRVRTLAEEQEEEQRTFRLITGGISAAGLVALLLSVWDGLRLSALGLAFGLPVSLLGLHFLMGSDPDIPVIGLPPVTTIAALGVVLVAIAAAWLPARRATAIDPAVTLRRE